MCTSTQKIIQDKNTDQKNFVFAYAFLDRKHFSCIVAQRAGIWCVQAITTDWLTFQEYIIHTVDLYDQLDQSLLQRGRGF